MNTSKGRLETKGTLPLDRFVARLNIEHLQRKLAEETNSEKRQVLARLLAEEEAKLAALDVPKNEDKKD
jgi:hypothetical protein